MCAREAQPDCFQTQSQISLVRGMDAAEFAAIAAANRQDDVDTCRL